MSKRDKLDPDKIKSNLKTQFIGQEILVYSNTSSTNDTAAEYSKNKKNNGLVIFAEEQTAGRGRAGNKWITGQGDSILCSVVLTKCKLNTELISLTCAVASAEAIGKKARIKWPNDIIINNKKVAGILLESKKHRGNIVYILGIGINCHQKKETFPSDLQPIATSIDIETKRRCDRIILAKRLLTSIDIWLEVAEKNSEKIIDRWRKLSIQLGHRVKLVYNSKKYTGNCIGIDPEKGLIVQLERGGVRMFDAAHTTIAK